MKKTQIKISKFIIKLLEILENQEYSSIIKWSQNGAGVQILDKNKLHQQVLFTHFKLRKGTSFIRKLHLYGFSKKKNQQHQNIFEHRHFLKDSRQNYSKIRRTYKDKKPILNNYSDINLQKSIATQQQQKTLTQQNQWNSIQNIFWQKKQNENQEDIFVNWNLQKDEEASFFIQNYLM